MRTLLWIAIFVASIAVVVGPPKDETGGNDSSGSIKKILKKAVGRGESSVNPNDPNAYLGTQSKQLEFMVPILYGAAKDFELKWNNPEPCHGHLNDFRIIEPLGSGAGGRVVLVWHQQSQQYYAMKILTKSVIVTGNIKEVFNEKHVLRAINSPFLTKMDYCFQDNANLYMLMEYMCGKDLSHMSTTHGHLKEAQAKFYAAQMALALHYLHSMNLIHRDFKAENVLVDEHGYIRLADFGLTHRVDGHGRLNERCGTPLNRAPEMILNQGYGKEIDWWGLGLTIYQMIAGQSPFHMRTTTYKDENHYHVNYPADFSPELKHLLTHLLQPDPHERYGINEVMRHKWFQGINWEKLYHKQIPAPLKPHCPKHDNTKTHVDSAKIIGNIPHTDPHADKFQNF